MLKLRDLSLDSIRLALATRLLHLDAADVIPSSQILVSGSRNPSGR